MRCRIDNHSKSYCNVSFVFALSGMKPSGHGIVNTCRNFRPGRTLSNARNRVTREGAISGASDVETRSAADLQSLFDDRESRLKGAFHGTRAGNFTW